METDPRDQAHPPSRPRSRLPPRWRFVALILAGVAVVQTTSADRRPPADPDEERKEQEERARAEQAQREILQAAVARDPGSAEAWEQLGDHLYAYRHPEEAEAAWRRSLRLEPAQAEVRWSLGTSYSERGDDVAAQAEYEAALEIDPDHTGALNNLGVLYQEQGRLGDAERLLKRAAAVDGTGFWQLGRVYAEQGRWHDAADAYERSLSSRGQHISVFGEGFLHGHLGEAQMQLGRDAEAIKSLETSLHALLNFEQHPLSGGSVREIAEVSYRLACLLARGGDPQAALSHLRRALGRDPELREAARVETDLEPVRRLPEAAELDLGR